MSQTTPTQTAHLELQAAYDRLNIELFDAMLPACLITLQRKSKNCYGYFSATRFGAVAGERVVDELAMNPQHFRQQTPVEILQTLAHEMCHAWQFHHGKQKANRSYHNKEWGAKMEEIGLMPSHNGQPGGKRTGQHMLDYVIAGGRFETVTKAMVVEGFAPSYYDRDEPKKTTNDGHEAETVEGNGETLDATPSGKRIKYRCPGCRAQAWGKAQLQIACLPCIQVFVPVARA